MNQFSEHLQTSEGRDWLAMLYVLGEMTQSDRDAFEAMMFAEPQLCDAVVNASRMATLLHAAVHVETASKPMTLSETEQPYITYKLTGEVRRRFAARISISAAAMVLMGLMVFLGRGALPETTEISTLEESEAADAFVRLLDDGSGTDADIAFDAGLDEVTDDLLAPGWLLTAVELDDSEAASDALPAEPGAFF